MRVDIPTFYKSFRRASLVAVFAIFLRSSQNHLGGVQTFFLSLLSPPGRAHVTGVVRQRGGLYGPGALPLKDPVKDYTGYTGSHKGLLGSVQLIVFRGLLASVSTMVRI